VETVPTILFILWPAHQLDFIKSFLCSHVLLDNCDGNFFNAERRIAESGGVRSIAFGGFDTFSDYDGFGGGLLHLGFHRSTSASTRRQRQSSPAGRGLLPQVSQWLWCSRWLWHPQKMRGPL
jgi:hypothetical protein